MTEQKKPEEQTIEEKSVIFDILKFTPQDYNITVWGYGGTSRFLRATKEQYKYFQEHEIDIEEYASDYDNEQNVPEDMQPFPPGEHYEGDEVACASGATMDSSSWITITDENGNEVFKCSLDPDALDDMCVETDETVEFCPDYDCEKGTVLVWCGEGDKGTFIDTTLKFNKPFDPKLLKVSYQDIDGWLMMSYIEYDGEELYDDGLSTTGKWGENRWIVVGGDEALDLIENTDGTAELRDPVELEPQTTDWYPGEVKPVRNGMYECTVDGVPAQAWPFANMHMIEWTGKKWVTPGTVTAWRGLKAEAK